MYSDRLQHVLYGELEKSKRNGIRSPMLWNLVDMRLPPIRAVHAPV